MENNEPLTINADTLVLAANEDESTVTTVYSEDAMIHETKIGYLKGIGVGITVTGAFTLACMLVNRRLKKKLTRKSKSKKKSKKKSGSK